MSVWRMSATTPTMVVSYLMSVASAFVDLLADGVLRIAIELLRERHIDDRDFGLIFGIGNREFPAGEDGLVQRGEVAGRDARLFEVHVLFFGGLVSLHRVVRSIRIAGEFRIGGSRDTLHAGN